MPRHLRRVPVAPEMYAFQAEIGRDQQFVTGRRTQHCAIVADEPTLRARANTAYELSFR